MAAIQIVDENKQFNGGLDAYLAQEGLAAHGLAYHSVAVFGSQSSGKSTLLNHVFGTQFSVMDSRARRQTTHGIWLSYDARDAAAPVLVLDVEGTDGRERGDDQDFERKAALFALATSEILVVNMWENQVGLYFGANMALLRTVFEVNLSLFHTGSAPPQRSRVLFVIRDFTAQTPLEQLASTLREDLDTQWASLAKPAGLEQSKVADYFDVDFAALPHKVWQPEPFAAACVALRTQILASFEPEYHRQVPIDGWAVYASNVWQKIEENKDLDLPSHHELVAKFRCQEIANECFDRFVSQCEELNAGLGEPAVVPEFGRMLSERRAACLNQFDEVAGRYQKTVYQEKRRELAERVDAVIAGWHAAQLDAAKLQVLAAFRTELNAAATGTETFGARTEAALAKAESDFAALVAASTVEGAELSSQAQTNDLRELLATIATQIRREELQKLLRQLARDFAARFDAVDALLLAEDPFPWRAVRNCADEALQAASARHGADLGLGGSEEELAHAQLALAGELWLALAAKVRALTTVDAVAQRLRDRFEEVFKYNSDGLPVVWAPGDDIASQAVKAREAALELLPLYARAVLNEDDELLVVPEEVAVYLQLKGEDVPVFDALLSPQQRADVERRFQRFADAGFVEAKRSVMQMTTHIPTYIIVLLVVLGWNEFMLVLRNPLILALCLVLAGVYYALYTLGLTATAAGLVQSYATHALRTTKAVARDYLLKPDAPVRDAKREPVRTESDSD